MRTKALLLLAVGMAVVVGAEMPSSSVEKARERNTASTERTALKEIGASISHPEGLVVDQHEQT